MKPINLLGDKTKKGNTMRIPDPLEIMEQQIERQCDLVDDDLTYPCHYCGRRFHIDDMHPISSHPAASLQCMEEDCATKEKEL